MPSLPAIHALRASRQAIVRKGRFVPASCRSQVSPPSAVWKMRPSSPAIQPSRSVAKQVPKRPWRRSEEHTSELQSLTNLVCRLLLEKKKTKNEQPLVYERQQRLTV